MSEGQPGPRPGDGEWPERYAETGGWPPPGPDQQRYGPGPAGPPAVPWAAGDSRYGRLPGGTWGGPPQRPPAPRPPARRPSPTRGGTPVMLTLIVLNVLGFLFQQADPDLTYRYGLLPVAVEAGQYERLLTAAFLHASLLHLASNMLALYLLGAPLERVLGSGRFTAIYLTSALGGSLLALALSPPTTLGVGASGAVFGLFGALAVLRNRVGADARSIGLLIGINLVISFTVPNVSWQAHVGGLVTGAVVALLVAGRPPARRPG